MAPFSNYISFLFLTTLLLPLQIIARESTFFSKVPHSINNNNVKETEVPKKEGPENKPEEQPVFIPETENSYGLYGHESTQLPSTTYEPYEKEFQHTSKYPNKYHHHNYNKNDAYYSNQNDELSNTRLTGNYNNYYNKDAYEGNQNELSDTKYTEGEFNNMENQNNNYKKHYYYNNNGANNMYNGEKQGMSDTRFLEGGKYFYDVNYEKYNNPTLYSDSSREVNTHRHSNNWYNNRGNNNNYYGNNNNNGYQNQEEFEDDQEFEP
ncbi:hypothetical protein RIF29_41329 [Crotalaria pallida]|uniref:Protein E6 n=1 Tax=Crotalaria pallida TaxID=3830 RepID=A0AAN9E670_CROPI